MKHFLPKNVALQFRARRVKSLPFFSKVKTVIKINIESTEFPSCTFSSRKSNNTALSFSN